MATSLRARCGDLDVGPMWRPRCGPMWRPAPGHDTVPTHRAIMPFSRFFCCCCRNARCGVLRVRLGGAGRAFLGYARSFFPRAPVFFCARARGRGTPRRGAGTTAVAVFVTPTHFVCANAGDSRSCYCTTAQVPRAVLSGGILEPLLLLLLL